MTAALQARTPARWSGATGRAQSRLGRGSRASRHSRAQRAAAAPPPRPGKRPERPPGKRAGPQGPPTPARSGKCRATASGCPLTPGPPEAHLWAAAPGATALPAPAPRFRLPLGLLNFGGRKSRPERGPKAPRVGGAGRGSRPARELEAAAWGLPS